MANLFRAFGEGLKSAYRVTEEIRWELEHSRKPITVVGVVGGVLTGLIAFNTAPLVLTIAGGAILGPVLATAALAGTIYAVSFLKGFARGLNGNKPEQQQAAPKVVQTSVHPIFAPEKTKQPKKDFRATTVPATATPQPKAEVKQPAPQAAVKQG